MVITDEVTELLQRYTTRGAEALEIAIDLWHPLKKRGAKLETVLMDVLDTIAYMQQHDLLRTEQDHLSNGDTIQLYGLV